MPLVQSFEPVIGVNPRVLILGSMPGVASLNAQQYYAHPRNAFWPILSELSGVKWAENYEERIQQVKMLPLVLWDVLRSCQRKGSLDSDIDKDRLEPNEIPELLHRHASIALIAFNGTTSKKIFQQKVALSIPDITRLQLVCLPSTSPAHASKTLQQKLQEWRVIEPYMNLT